jgi:hypothetical protein
MREEAEGVRIGQGSMLWPILDVVTPLNKVKTSRCSIVGSNKDATFAVKVQGPGIPASFRE